MDSSSRVAIAQASALVLVAVRLQPKTGYEPGRMQIQSPALRNLSALAARCVAALLAFLGHWALSNAQMAPLFATLVSS